MLQNYIDQILNINNFTDGLIITDHKGFIESYHTFRPNINSIKEKEVLGKHILEVYPQLTEETSMIMRTLKTGASFHNEYQEVVSFKGQKRTLIETVLPIKKNNKIIGALNLTKYVVDQKLNSSVDLMVNTYSSKKESDLYIPDDIITNSNQMLKIKDKLYKVAKTDSPVLVFGETGTGKEMIAQSIHSLSKRKKAPFISQNCATIPSNLLEGLLFGTCKGSYTGSTDKKGLFELAQNGTFFLDELNAMDLNVQAKILKAIEEKKIRRLGGEAEINLNVRFVAALNEDPFEAIKNNKIREDLYYRLSTVYIKIPTLKERKDDINLLTDKFINHFNEKMNMQVSGVTDEVREIFNNHDWPGNVRELKNAIESSFVFSTNNVIGLEDLPEHLLIRNNIKEKSKVESKYTLTELVDNYEKDIIKTTLAKSRNVTDASRKLGISRQALNYKLSKFQLK